jgi:hypothetical protein
MGFNLTENGLEMTDEPEWWIFLKKILISSVSYPIRGLNESSLLLLWSNIWFQRKIIWTFRSSFKIWKKSLVSFSQVLNESIRRVIKKSKNLNVI